jgi:hypothetical protein
VVGLATGEIAAQRLVPLEHPPVEGVRLDRSPMLSQGGIAIQGQLNVGGQDRFGLVQLLDGLRRLPPRSNSRARAP